MTKSFFCWIFGHDDSCVGIDHTMDKELNLLPGSFATYECGRCKRQRRHEFTAEELAKANVPYGSAA
jgi:hypothetical protein